MAFIALNPKIFLPKMNKKRSKQQSLKQLNELIDRVLEPIKSLTS